MQNSPPISSTPSAQLAQDMHRLYQLKVYSRWLLVLGLWLTIGAASLWQLRFRIQIVMDYFTWAAVKYGLASHIVAAFGLALCLGATGGVLTWQIRNRLLGLPKQDRDRLQQQVIQIRKQGQTHPLWRWLNRKEKGL
ncbi:MAG: hypothetical protein MH252_07425 [Thermosynechococcaceae cyanobacterium MS004]|nr:hypothetical protein [Thermosynechococcaceae cyanobacterium MS004]